MSLFRYLGRTKVSVQGRSFVCEYFVTNIHFHGEELFAPRPTPKLEDHYLSAVRDSLLNIFAATLNIRGRSSIRKLRTRHAVMTGIHLSHGCAVCKLALIRNLKIRLRKIVPRQSGVTGDNNKTNANKTHTIQT
jgi:hypothetical protein